MLEFMWCSGSHDSGGPYSILEFPPYQIFGFLVLLGLVFVGWVIELVAKLGPVGAAKEVASFLASCF
ncbi:MAG: hypothetical protein ACPLRW_04820 [Moorellales bacterium]